jgi:hypothetical protein
LIERGRARELSDRVSLGTLQDLHAIQSRLVPNSMLLDVWTGAESLAIVWISPSRAGFVRHAGAIENAAEELVAALQTGTEHWRDSSRLLGDLLLPGVPLARRHKMVRRGLAWLSTITRKGSQATPADPEFGCYNSNPRSANLARSRG